MCIRDRYKKWSYDSLPILPQEWKYTVSADKEKQFKTLKELMHRADVSEEMCIRDSLEGYGNDNPGAKSQGIKQLMAGGGVALIGTILVPLLSGLFG